MKFNMNKYISTINHTVVEPQLFIDLYSRSFNGDISSN